VAELDRAVHLGAVLAGDPVVGGHRRVVLAAGANIFERCTLTHPHTEAADLLGTARK
jgi:hypothetical protein